MCFNDPALVAIYGSWVRVQVAFYDFLFLSALEMCPECFRQKAVAEAMSGGFADGEDFYERSVKKIEENLTDFDTAWNLFKANQPLVPTPKAGRHS